MIDIKQFRTLIIEPALKAIDLYSADAEELLVATCAHESLGATYVAQVSGPALGIFQMEPATYNSLWETTLSRRTDIAKKILDAVEAKSRPDASRLVYDMRYATFMTRIFYYRIAEPLPPRDDIDKIWAYYKKYYNTQKGSAKQSDFIKKYYRFLNVNKN